MVRKTQAERDAEAEAAAADDEIDGDGGRQRRKAPIEIKNLPAGVKAVFRMKPWRDAENYVVYIYQLIADPQKPGRETRKFRLKVFNTEVEEAWLQQKYPSGGRFRVMYQVPHPEDSGDVQLLTDDYDVGPADIATAPAQVAPGSGAAPAGASTPAGDPLGGLMHLDRLADILVKLRGGEAFPAPAAAAAPAWMEKMYQEKLKSVSDLEDRLQRKLLGSPVVTQNKPSEESHWPKMLEPFLPQLQNFGIRTLQQLTEKILGGDLISKAMRTLLINNPMFLTIWNDVPKRNALVENFVGILGQETTENLVRTLAKAMETPT